MSQENVQLLIPFLEWKRAEPILEERPEFVVAAIDAKTWDSREEVIDCGDQVVALTRQHGHGSASGAVAELEYGVMSQTTSGGQ